MERVILHSDLNNFYASAECLYRPEIRGKAVAVGGDEEQRHSIVLAKNYIAKKYEIKTGDTLNEARQKCPGLVVVPTNMRLYKHFSNVARDIYYDYSDKVEAFGIDECWLDCTGSAHLFGGGKAVADRIRERIKIELGVTCSIGVSYNKIFAKLGSDMRKPDATTVISRENFKEKVWPLPVGDLLMVGPATRKALQMRSLNTIGDLAREDMNYIQSFLISPGR